MTAGERASLERLEQTLHKRCDRIEDLIETRRAEETERLDERFGGVDSRLRHVERVAYAATVIASGALVVFGGLLYALK